MEDNSAELAIIEDRLDQIERLLRHILAVAMYANGARQGDIARSMGIAIGSVNKMVKGVDRAQPAAGNRDDA